MNSNKKKILECVLGAIVALALGFLISFILIGAILEGEKTTHYNNVIVGEVK